MTTKTKSPNGTVHDLSGFRLPPVYEPVVCERDDVNEGLTRPLEITVLVNPPRAEILAMSRAYADIQERNRAAMQDADYAATKDAFDLEAFDLIAPRITAWNVEALNGADEIVPLPPPAEAGGAVITLLPQPAQTWLLSIVPLAHLGGETRSKLSRRPAPTAAIEAVKTPSGPQIVDTPTGETPRSRRKSS